MSYILSVDLGGSKCSLGLWQSSCSSLPQKVSLATIPTAFADEQDLLAAIHQFIAAYNAAVTIEGCTLAMAGPARPGAEELRLTNNPCRLHPAALRQGLGCPLAILNDLEALAHALPALSSAQLEQVCPGSPDTPGFAAPTLTAAVGTGLGVAARLPGGRVVPTEAGHCTYAPEGAEQAALWQGLCQKLAGLPSAGALVAPEQAPAPYPAPYNEQILSGAGLCNILSIIYPAAPAELLQNPARVTACALSAENAPDKELQAACRETFRLFSACLGTAMSNLALVFLCSGGVYLGGGVLDKIGSLFDRQAFAQAFIKPGAFQSTLAQIPVWLIKEPDALLLGAAIYTERNLLG